MAYTLAVVLGDGWAMDPFLGSAAVRCGQLTRRGLSRHHRAIYRDVYLPRDVELTARLKAQAAWLSTGATLCGLSAAAMLGTRWIDPGKPAEVLRRGRRAQQGMVSRSFRVSDDEIGFWASVPVTTPARTAFDIGRRYPPDEAIPILDALQAATGVEPDAIAAVAGRWPGVRGVRRLRSILEFIDGKAESPQESRLRLILVRGGLPVPECQIRFPELRIRVDMGWQEWRVAVEYDGVQHWVDAAQRSWDIERIALLETAGWTVVRVSAQMLRRPELIVDRIRGKLRAAGCPI